MNAQAQAKKLSVFTHLTARLTSFRDMSVAQLGKVLLRAGIVVFFAGFLITRFEPVPNTVGGVLWQIVQEGYSNFGIELVSIAITVIVVDDLSRRRDAREREANEIAIRERDKNQRSRMGSRVNELALDTIREARKEGWLEDGNLQRADLSSANLQNADLNQANLQSAKLYFANLRGAELEFANLQSANLYFANLQGAGLRFANLRSADLRFAKLQGASLRDVNLQGANLYRADLQGANLYRANLQNAYFMFADLQGANLEDTQFDEATTLPDQSKWTPGRDMREFTNPDGWAAGKYKQDTSPSNASPDVDAPDQTITSPGADAPPSP